MYRIVPRHEAGLPSVVTNSNGTLRPRLHNEPFMTAHYTGNNIDYTGKDAAQVTREIQRVFSATKPFEYNYVIGQNEDDQIIEYAGKFQAAHSAGENQDAFGVLFLLGVGESPTETMINKWRWLREVLQFDGSLSMNVDQRQHRQMPGAATACPGAGIITNWSRFLEPYKSPTPTPDPPPPVIKEDTMLYIAKPTFPGVTANTAWLAVFESGAVRRAVNSDLTFASIAKLPTIELNSAEQHGYLCQKFGI